MKAKQDLVLHVEKNFLKILIRVTDLLSALFLPRNLMI